MFIFIIKFILFFVPLLIAIAFLTLLERKIIASFQQRKGPNIVGFLGLLQPLADGIKLFLKESTFPSFISILLFLLAPLITFSCAIALWYVIPFSYWNSLINFDLNVLYILILSSFGVYGIILSGWASNSKYAFLGALRASAQMISYEVSLTLIILHLIIFTKSFNLLDIIEFQKDIWFIIPLFPSFLLFFISSLAETNRTPFDLAEAEGELVAGYNVEYSALTFALFFLGEYSNIIFMSVLTTILFCGGWDIIFFFDFFYEIWQFVVKNIIFYWTIDKVNIIDYFFPDLKYLFNNKYFLQFYFDCNTLIFLDSINNFFQFYEKNYFLIMFFIFTIKILIFIFIFVWTRATYPRYRYNQLMVLGWKVFLPLSIGILILNYSINLIILL